MGTIYICFVLLELVLRIFPTKCNFNERRYGDFIAHDKRDTFFKIKRYRLWPYDHYLSSPGEFCYFRKINSENLSDKETPLNKNANEVRIIGMGDSFTEGVGAPFDSTWVKQLEFKLNKNKNNNKTFTSINAGVIGSDPVFEYVLLKDKLLKYDPDVVIFCINISDISDILSRGGFERFNENGIYLKPKAVWWEWIYASLFCVRYIFDNFLNFDFYAFKFKNDKTDNEVINTIKNIILTLEKDSLNNKFELVIVFHPFREEVLRKRYYADFIQIKDYISQYCPEIKIVDLLSLYIEKYKMDDYNIHHYFWKIDGHHNSKGYELFARGIEDELKESGIIDSLIKK